MKVLVHLWCPYIVLIIQLNTILQLYIISIIHKPAVTIKFSGHLDSGSETVTSTSFETPYDSSELYVYTRGILDTTEQSASFGGTFSP